MTDKHEAWCSAWAPCHDTSLLHTATAYGIAVPSGRGVDSHEMVEPGVDDTAKGLHGEQRVVDAHQADTTTEDHMSIGENTLANGGGTFVLSTGRPVTPTAGFAVGVYRGTFAQVAADPALIDAAVLSLKREGLGVTYVGTWLDPDTGMVDVDPIRIVRDEMEARRLAVAYGQKAIYDFATGETIYVTGREPRYTIDEDS